MNPNDELTSLPADERRLDFLVDDELDEPERRALLSRLEQEPDGWRRCALAFLESQSWRKELGSMVRRPIEAVGRPATAGPARWRGRLGTLLAVAASFLVAFLLGTRLRDGWPAGPAGGRPMAGALATGEGEAHRLVSAPAGPGHRQDASADPAQNRGGPAEQWEMVTLAAPEGSGGAMEPIRVPAVRRDTLDPGWLERLPGAMPADVLQAFQRTGHEVRQHRELIPVDLNDGRRLVMPVEQVDVHFVGRPAL